jgi:hypothetical protein
MLEAYLTYDEWIDAVFNHPVAEPAWYFTEIDNPELWNLYYHHPAIALQYMTRVFKEINKLPTRYSDGQIADGLDYLVNPACSNHVGVIIDANDAVSFEDQLHCIKSIYSVYEQLFSTRCSTQLSATNKDGTNRKLNIVCFMWWDTFPTYGGEDKVLVEKMESAIHDVIVRISTLDSEACKKAALHGLNEWHFKYPQKVNTLVKEFLARNPQISPELKDYAEKASWGALP